MKSIWLKMKDLFQTELSKEFKNEIKRKIALEFYKRFKDTPITFEEDSFDYILKESCSVSLKIYDGWFIVPEGFYMWFMDLDDEEKFISIFDSELHWQDLMIRLWENVINRRSDLVETDVEILKIISDFHNTNVYGLDKDDKKGYYIRYEVFEKLLTKSTRWITERYLYLFKANFGNNIVINPYNFGYDLFLLAYNKAHEKEARNLNHLSMLKVSLLNNENVRVICLPNIRERKKFISFDHKLYNILENDHYVNLEELHHKEELSFKSPPKQSYFQPNFTFKHDNPNWFKKYSDLDQELYPNIYNYSLERKLDRMKIILSYFSKGGGIDGSWNKIAKLAKTSITEFIEISRFLFNNNIVTYLPSFGRIGLNLIFTVKIESIGNYDLNLINKNLMRYPQSDVYKSKRLLVLYIKLPRNYLADFHNFIKNLNQNENIKVNYGPFQILKDWTEKNIIIPNDVIISEMGIEFPNLY